MWGPDGLKRRLDGRRKGDILETAKIDRRTTKWQILKLYRQGEIFVVEEPPYAEGLCFITERGGERMVYPAPTVKVRKDGREFSDRLKAGTLTRHFEFEQTGAVIKYGEQVWFVAEIYE